MVLVVSYSDSTKVLFILWERWAGSADTSAVGAPVCGCHGGNVLLRLLFTSQTETQQGFRITAVDVSVPNRSKVGVFWHQAATSSLHCWLQALIARQQPPGSGVHRPAINTQQINT